MSGGGGGGPDPDSQFVHGLSLIARWTRILTADANGRPHSHNDAPALRTKDGLDVWCHHGAVHRVGGPAMTDGNGFEFWLQSGIPHREDGPAVIDPDGKMWTYYDGYVPEFPREVMLGEALRTHLWMVRGQMHGPDDGREPALVAVGLGGVTELAWYRNGVLHHDGAPAVVVAIGNKMALTKWFADGERHRVDGPAFQKNQQALRLVHEAGYPWTGQFSFRDVPEFWLNGQETTARGLRKGRVRRMLGQVRSTAERVEFGGGVSFDPAGGGVEVTGNIGVDLRPPT